MYKAVRFAVVIFIVLHAPWIICADTPLCLPLNDAILTQACDHFKDNEDNKAHLAIPHKPVIILFSACAGMGKSTISKHLQEQLKIVNFDAWGARVFLRDNGYFSPHISEEDKLSRFLACFRVFLTQMKEHKNQTILFDESIDRKTPEPPIADRLKQMAESSGYELYIIKLQVAKAVAQQRLQQRECNSDARTIAHFKQRFDRYYADYEAFSNECVDFMLPNEDIPVAQNERLKELITQLQKKIQHEQT